MDCAFGENKSNFKPSYLQHILKEKLWNHRCN